MHYCLWSAWGYTFQLWTREATFRIRPWGIARKIVESMLHLFITSCWLDSVRHEICCTISSKPSSYREVCLASLKGKFISLQEAGPESWQAPAGSCTAVKRCSVVSDRELICTACCVVRLRFPLEAGGWQIRCIWTPSCLPCRICN